MVIKKVLLAIDFSRASMQLVECLDEFQSLGLEEVVLVHVIDSRSPGGTAAAFRTFEQEILNSLKAKLEAIGLRVKLLLPVGIPTFELVKIAQAEQVSLILISSHGQGYVKNILLGSTTNDVIRTSPVPVLIEKYREVDPDTLSLICLRKFRRVLLPLDFSAPSQKLLEEIRGLAPLIEEVIILSVIEGAADEGQLQELLQQRQALLQEKQHDLEQLGLKVRTLLRQGSASIEIITTAEAEDVTLIMLANRGGGLIKELLLGRTAHEVIRGSKRSVLLIPTLKR